MIKLALIRHFATGGNLEKRYIGRTDEALCEEGKRKLKEITYEEVDCVFASPLKRCLETANLIYPNVQPVIYEDLRECDFGDLENKNYMELTGNKDYSLWIESGGTLPFPNGEKVEEFKRRTVKAFDKVMNKSIEKQYEKIAIIAHGGTIMSVLDEYSYPHKDYYSWQVKNGEGFLGEFDEENGKVVSIWSIH